MAIQFSLHDVLRNDCCGFFIGRNPVPLFHQEKFEGVTGPNFSESFWFTKTRFAHHSFHLSVSTSQVESNALYESVSHPEAESEKAISLSSDFTEYNFLAIPGKAHQKV